jgi:pimeloyl-ACP methyl ester carboxylesterase
MSATPNPQRRGPGRVRRFGAAFLLAPAALFVGPYLVPLPRTPNRAAGDVAAALGLGGRLVDAQGTRLWVEEAGPGDGEPVVLIHGFGGSTWSWRETLPALAGAGYHAVAIDLANFGLSDKSWLLDTSHAAHADRVAAVMDALDLGSASLVGHSMGANVLAWFAVRHPHRVTRAILVDALTGPAERRRNVGAAILLRPPSVRRIGQLVLRSQLREGRMGAFLRSAYADPARVTAETIAGYAAPLQTVDWDLGLLAIVRDAGPHRLPAPIGEILRVPTTIIWGRADRWVPLAAGETLRAALPDAEWHIIDDAGHLPMQEQPAAFNDVVLTWLERTR